jgi:lipopolysaccharide exporter
VQKDLRFGARFVPEVVQAGVKAVLAVLLAWAGLGVWSLVLAQLAGVAAWTLALWRVVPWRPAWRWPGDLLVPMLAYGRGIVVINVLAAVTHHADLVIVGRRLGVEALGFYQIAYKVPEMSIAILIWAASRVLFPTLVRIQAEGKEIRDAYLTSLRYTSLLTVPMAVGLAVLARPLVRTLFGAPWDPAVPLLQALALYLGLRSLSIPAGDVFKAIGRPGLLAGISLIKAAVLLPVLVFLSGFGAAAVAAGLAAVTVLTLALSLGIVARWTGATARATWHALEASVVGSAVMAAAVGGGLRLTEGWAPLLVVAVGLFLGISAYALTVRLLSPHVYEEVWRGFFGSPAPLSAPR